MPMEKTYLTPRQAKTPYSIVPKICIGDYVPDISQCKILSRSDQGFIHKWVNYHPQARKCVRFFVFITFRLQSMPPIRQKTRSHARICLHFWGFGNKNNI